MTLRLADIDLIYNAGRVDEVVALRNLSVTFERGQFVTVVGTNGAGKSSLIQTISGAARPTRGRIHLDDRDVTRLPDHRRAGWIARVFDDPRAGTAPELSIEDNLALAMARGRSRGLRFAVTARRRAVMREHVAGLGLGLENRLADRVGLLSAGQRQSLTMVMAALSAPSVLLLDERLAALDPGTTATVLALTTELVRELGATTVMVTHNMDHALALGDRLLVMSRGRVIADYDGTEKSEMTVSGLIDRITGAGDALSDRSALIEQGAR
ncbi:ATP-binding cassette domain-containing protein [Candidatus Frankia alpina]|uniref:ATP-binding cassette domain-containing protein n=1 Tax=Candidatus Frankia alpina TaxID=2699483 RepID=A0A4S5EQM9_9ACTN|nr:ATP-binding cassette domain-containing protein [Candidatus Frankia alpina]